MRCSTCTRSQVDPATPVKQGAPVCVVARTVVPWCINPLQIVYAKEGVHRRTVCSTGACAAPSCLGRRGKETACQKLACSQLLALSHKHAEPLPQLPAPHPPPPPHCADAVHLQPQHCRRSRLERFQFAHGCLQGHLLAGEESFAVEWDRGDDSVWWVWSSQLGFGLAGMCVLSQALWSAAWAAAFIRAACDEFRTVPHLITVRRQQPRAPSCAGTRC